MGRLNHILCLPKSQDWEQGRRKTFSPALSLLKVSELHPDAIREAV